MAVNKRQAEPVAFKMPLQIVDMDDALMYGCCNHRCRNLFHIYHTFAVNRMNKRSRLLLLWRWWWN